jgi:mono/diheme cytochrome c family protein
MKKRWLKIALYSFGGLIGAIALLLSYVKLGLPNVGPAPEMHIEGTAGQIARGEYLANNVAVCMECHSQRDWSLQTAPSTPGTRGMGGEVHGQRLGFPGKYVSPNLTPFALSDWTDGELFRAITTGVSKNGRALFPIMPHHNFGRLDEEDIKSVIAYLRTLEPIEYTPEASKSDFPMNFIINTIPQKAQLAPMPAPENLVEYGKYLVTAGTCYDCHTQQKDGTYIGADFAGGSGFTLEDGSVVRSANLTPHATGLGSWTEEAFISRFKVYSDSNYVAPKVEVGDFQTVMPWNTYAGMDEQDLKAIYHYLRSLEPVENEVVKFTSVND